MFVVDSSAIIDFLTDIDAHPRIGRILLNDPAALNAPHLIDLEVLSALRQMVFDGRIDAERASGLLVDFDALPIERHSHDHFVRRIWQLRDNINPYDAVYVALAELLDAPLLTRDAKLARSGGHAARIEYID